MTSPHLSERALQEAAESSALLSASQMAHLHGCSPCRNQVAVYQQLFAATAQLPPPAFAFDLTARVLAQLPQPRPAFPWVLGGVAALVLGVVVVFLLLFGGAVAQAVQSLPGTGLAVVATLLAVGQGAELLARHRRQMRQLSFS